MNFLDMNTDESQTITSYDGGSFKLQPLQVKSGYQNKEITIISKNQIMQKNKNLGIIKKFQTHALGKLLTNKKIQELCHQHFSSELLHDP